MSTLMEDGVAEDGNGCFDCVAAAAAVDWGAGAVDVIDATSLRDLLITSAAMMRLFGPDGLNKEMSMFASFASFLAYGDAKTRPLVDVAFELEDDAEIEDDDDDDDDSMGD